MSIAGHVSRAMLSRIEAKRHALDEIAARQCETDEKRIGKKPNGNGQRRFLNR